MNTEKLSSENENGNNAYYNPFLLKILLNCILFLTKNLFLILN